MDRGFLPLQVLTNIDKGQFRVPVGQFIERSLL